MSFKSALVLAVFAGLAGGAAVAGFFLVDFPMAEDQPTQAASADATSPAQTDPGAIQIVPDGTSSAETSSAETPPAQATSRQ